VTLRTHASVIGGYLAAAVFVTGRLWLDPGHRVMAGNGQDHVLFEWVLQHAAHTVVDLRNPFFTDWVNAPWGISLMSNTSVWLAALPLTPVTLAFGPGVAYALLVTVALAGTATAWYLVLCRLLASRAAAVVGGACCGFGPGMIAQATGHPHIASQFLLPFIVLCVLRLREPGPVVRPALTLAALIVCQVFLGEEALLLTAIALGLFVLVYAGMRPAEIRGALRRAAAVLGLAAAVSGAILAYPLYLQFAGPQSYSHLPIELINAYGADLTSYPEYSEQSLAGHHEIAGAISQGIPEQNAFFGWSLLVLLIFVGWRLRRDPAPRALFAVALIGFVLSLGTHIMVGGRDTGLPGPWLLLAHAPLTDSVIPTRFALVAWTAAALLVALFVDRFPSPRWLVAAVLVAALLPLLPRPMPMAPGAPTPEFFASGEWRRVVPAGGTVLLLPTGWRNNLDGMAWQTRTGMGFKIYGGYFLAPRDGVRGNPSELGPPPSRTGEVFGADDGWNRPPASDAQIAAARDEARRWHLDAVVLPADHPNVTAIRAEADRVYGPGRRIRDVWFWRLT
jgi:hypothetical protein